MWNADLPILQVVLSHLLV